MCYCGIGRLTTPSNGAKHFPSWASCFHSRGRERRVPIYRIYAAPACITGWPAFGQQVRGPRARLEAVQSSKAVLVKREEMHIDKVDASYFYILQFAVPTARFCSIFYTAFLLHTYAIFKGHEEEPRSAGGAMNHTTEKRVMMASQWKKSS